MNLEPFDSEVSKSLPRRAVQVTEVTLRGIFVMNHRVVGHLDQPGLADVG